MFSLNGLAWVPAIAGIVGNSPGLNSANTMLSGLSSIIVQATTIITITHNCPNAAVSETQRKCFCLANRSPGQAILSRLYYTSERLS